MGSVRALGAWPGSVHLPPCLLPPSLCILVAMRWQPSSTRPFPLYRPALEPASPPSSCRSRVLRVSTGAGATWPLLGRQQKQQHPKRRLQRPGHTPVFPPSVGTSASCSLWSPSACSSSPSQPIWLGCTRHRGCSGKYLENLWGAAWQGGGAGRVGPLGRSCSRSSPETVPHGSSEVSSPTEPGKATSKSHLQKPTSSSAAVRTP